MIKRRKRKDGTFGYLVRVKDRYGRQFKAETFDRKIDAEAHEALLKGQRHTGSLAPTQVQKNLTVNGYWDQWSSQRLCHEGWHYSEKQIYRDYIKPVIGEMKLSEVQRPDTKQVVVNAIKVMKRSKQTACHAYQLMHKMFDDAVEDGVLHRMPLSKRDRPKVALKERNFLEPSESEKLRQVSKDHWLGPAIWIGIYCGLRPCEIIALQKKHIDRERNQILIRQAYKRKAGINRIEPFPKQEDWGRAKIPLPLRAYLDDRIDSMADEDFVCRGKFGGMLNYIVLNRSLKDLCAKAQVKVITPHELRHSCSEEWIQVGATETDVGRQLNQKSSATTKRYMHRTDGRLDALSEKFGANVPTSDQPPKLRVVASN